MSFQALTWAVQQQLPVQQKMVLLMLANRTNPDHGRCDPTHQKLATDCGMSPESVKRSIRALAERGLLTIRRRWDGDVSLPNQYDLHIGVWGQTDPTGCRQTPRWERTDPTVGSDRPTKQKSKHKDKQAPTYRLSQPFTAHDPDGGDRDADAIAHAAKQLQAAGVPAAKANPELARSIATAVADHTSRLVALATAHPGKPMNYLLAVQESTTATGVIAHGKHRKESASEHTRRLACEAIRRDEERRMGNVIDGNFRAMGNDG
ncbi:helix-turn-helix domain-containing protein [Xanthomonas campestris pv. raphani]|uniref:helix-turn-helix domain-containing protein n=1 Tax=Xanthomonas campestris TaxID=339 RepID=UPI002B224BC1|nr:helix-turn-helix domain-containing protein [Xanthomonas campestris]MEA9906096.1 helix-turn-helix domain-containing protein [Xanthomonas campestris pv. raphani]